MKNENSMVSIYNSHEQAENAVKILQKAGYNMKKLSIVGKDYYTQENVLGYYNMGESMQKWGGIGAFWGAIWGLLFGSAFFLIPGVGPLLIAGPFVSSLVGALEGAVAVGGLSALGAALANIGIPQNSIVQYETEIKAGKFMLIAHGTHSEIEHARETLGIEATALV